MAESKYYLDFNFPLKVVNLILALILGKNEDPQIADPAEREWFSQPRPGTDTTTEVITCTFKLPLSVSEITMDILRMPCVAEVWYQDRSNNWRPALDRSRLPLRVNVSRSDAKSYYKYHSLVYPIVAKAVQFRLTRTNDPTLEGNPYVVGLRNCLIRRNVYDRSQGQQYFEEEVDVLGNVISKYIKDWDANKAADDDPYTFWKSAPMPDPAAVANLYLDIRDDAGAPRTVDRLYIDPVYSGQMLNLYYSSDDTVGTRKLNPITIPPDADENTTWRIERGRTDTAAGVNESYYRWSIGVGPQNHQAAWIGVEWTPNFDAISAPAVNPVLFRAMNPDTAGTFKPMIEYDSGAGEFTLQFDDGTDTRTYSAAMGSVFTAGMPLRIVAGWRYDPDQVFIRVTNQRGDVLAEADLLPTTLPDRYSFDGQQEINNFRGTISALVLKLENYGVSADSFLVSPTYYVDPDPVIPDISTGEIPSTTLDNAIYAASWTSQEHGSGGAHDSAFDDKEWTPIWRDYVVVKGTLFLPQSVSCKYIKMEFTNLTEAPYPIYDSGVETRYKVFPTSVMQQSSLGPRLYTGTGGFLGLGTFISQNGVRSVNWLNPASVLDAIGSATTTQYSAVVIQQNPTYITETVPNSADIDPQETWRVEMGSQYVYRREALQPYILAEDAYVTTIKAEGLQVLQPYTDVPWEDIEAANPGAVTHVRSTGALPIRGTDWWIYPGQQLKIPANVMEKLTGSSTVTERKLTLEHRVRFNTTSVHRYDYRTLKRDAAIAYFAGVREVIPFSTTYIPGEDKPYFDFPAYDPDQWDDSPDHYTLQLPEGPTTTQKKLYPIPNRLFARNLNDWVMNNPSSAWSWDGSIGHWLRGTARATADELDHELLSSKMPATAAEEIYFSVWTRWASLAVNANDDVAIRWGIRYYRADDTLESEFILDELSFADWASVADSTAAPGADATTGWLQLDGTSITPTDAAYFRVLLMVTNKAVSGDVWFDSVKAETTDTELATLTKTLQTQSTFTKVACDFTDSGLWRGDSMWADANPDSQSIDDLELAPYTRTIPESSAGGAWSDTIKAWGGEDIEWGTPFGVVTVTIDANRRYDGKRVLRFTREAGAGEAGIKVAQWTHYIPLGLFRIGATWYKPYASTNQVTLRLRRVSDGVIIHEETVDPVVGRWQNYVTRFVEIPDTADQEYEVQMTLSGDAEDEMYLSDLYTEIANVRYFVRLGGTGAYVHEVTDLRYTNGGRTNVTTTTPVNQMSVLVQVLSPEAFAYGCRLSPVYLK